MSHNQSWFRLCYAERQEDGNERLNSRPSSKRFLRPKALALATLGGAGGRAQGGRISSATSQGADSTQFCYWQAYTPCWASRPR